MPLLAPLPSCPPAPQQVALVETRRMVPPLGSPAHDAAAGDLNADGEIDVLVLLEKGGAILLHGAGTGRFVQAPAGTVGLQDAAASLELGDVDGDGDLDAVAGPFLLKQQQGALVLRQTIPAQTPPSDLAFGDVDADGDLDLLLGGTAAVLHENDGAGAFQPAAGALPPGSYEKALALADLDLDADLDALVGGAPDRCLINAGGTFAAGPALTSDGSVEIDLCDADQDGDVDALAVSPSAAVVLEGDGAGGLAATSWITGVEPRSAFLRDFDGAGGADVVLFGADGVQGWTSAGGTLVPEGLRFPSFVAASTAVAEDLDGDGDLDLLAVPADVEGEDALPAEELDTARLWLNDGGGIFGELQERVARPRFQLAATSIAVGDCNCDGRLDVFVTNQAKARDALYHGDGLGGLTDASDTLPDQREPTPSVVLRDLDGDGALDVALGSLHEARVLRNDGAGAFTHVSGALAGSGATYVVAPVDVDDDGDFDLFGTHPADAPSGASVWINVGDATFARSAGLAVPGFAPLDAHAIDLDLDGDSDVVLGGGELRAYVNDGLGAFTPADPASIPQLSGLWAFDVGDGNQDGVADLLVSTAQIGVGVLAGDGAGGLGAPTWIGVVGLGGWADVNDDGFPDLYVRTHVAKKPVLRLFPGDGSGGFPSWVDIAGADVVRFADLDHDGDLEGLGLTNGLRVWINVGRGAVARETPLWIGKPFDMAVLGEPLVPWTLAASDAPASIPLAPYGTLKLDPAGLWIAGGGVLPASGRVDVTIPVQRDPSLLGAQVHWQGLIGAPPRFTQREPAKVTKF